MANDTVDKVLERFPYADGSLRRRFIAGGIVLLGALLMHWKHLKPIIQDFGAKDLITSPIIAIGLILLIYAVGNLVELLGELFLIRAASGYFWATSFPKRRIKEPQAFERTVKKLFLHLTCVPFIAIYNFLVGLTGRTSYKVDTKSRLSEEGKNLYDSLPEKVELGLSEPVGDNSEIAWKYLVDMFQIESDRKWARRYITRAKDVLAVTTALIIIAVIILLEIYLTFFIYLDLPKTTDTELLKFLYNEKSYLKTKLESIQDMKLRQNIDKEILNIIEMEREILRDYDTKYSFRSKVINEYEIAKIKLEKYIYLINDSLGMHNELKEYKPEESDRVIEGINTNIKILTDIKKSFTDLKSSLEKLLMQQKEESLQREKRTVLFGFLLTLSLFLLLSLYKGFFLTLDNAIVSILEILALKQSETAEQE
jgi:hypothetical protein